MSEITLHNWTLTMRPGVPLLLADRVSNHPHIGSGSYSHSSVVVWVDMDRNLAMTLNTLYQLDQPRAAVFDDPEIAALIEKLRPELVPDHVRRAHVTRQPWPHTDLRNDPVYQWACGRWNNSDAE